MVFALPDWQAHRSFRAKFYGRAGNGPTRGRAAAKLDNADDRDET